MAKLLAVYDNQKRIGTCDECGALLRYEYVTDIGIYGSECVHKHIHTPEWATLKGKQDAETFALRQQVSDKMYTWFTSHDVPYYYEFRDGSGYFQWYVNSTQKYVAPEVLKKLLADGYQKEFAKDMGHFKAYYIIKSD